MFFFFNKQKFPGLLFFQQNQKFFHRHNFLIENSRMFAGIHGCGKRQKNLGVQILGVKSKRKKSRLRLKNSERIRLC